jgi:hypothetical protein
MDYPGDVERVQLDDPTTHKFWKLLQTTQHLELDPHPGFKDNRIHVLGWKGVAVAVARADPNRLSARLGER